MKALSLHQPYASAVAMGVKRIETRSWRTNYRGPLAIHATARVLPQHECPAPVGPDGLGQPTCWLPEPWHDEKDGTDLLAFPVHYGAVVAVCGRVEVAPIGGPFDFRTGIFEGDGGDFPGQPVIVHNQLGGPESLVVDTADGRVVDVSDQLPWGDFTPGRFGWLFEDVEPVWPPIPARGRQGLWEWSR